jgi:hypothetical protein
MELGSDMAGQRVQVHGGPLDGAFGLVLSVAWEDGGRVVELMLDDGRAVAIREPARERASGALPRELGTP